jgi:hypothetical protein
MVAFQNVAGRLKEPLVGPFIITDMNQGEMMRKICLLAVVIGLSGIFVLMEPPTRSAVSAAEQGGKAAENRFAELEEKWGVRPLVLRLTGADHFLDFRYLVVDPVKAMPLMDRKKKVVLKEQDTGKTFHVTVNKIGAMRATTMNPKAGKHYHIMFTNAGMTLRKGEKVTIMIDEFMAENLVVE